MSDDIITEHTFVKYLLFPGAILAGILFRGGFPGGISPVLSIVGMALLFICLRSGKYPALTGLVFGAAFNFSLCSWIYGALVTEFKMSGFTASCFFIIVFGFILSIFFIVFALTAYKLIDTDLHLKKMHHGYFAVISIASVFTVLEWLRITFSLEYGWAQLATTLYTIPELFVLAGITGGSGLTFLLVLMAGCLWLSLIYALNGFFRKSLIVIVTALAVMGITWGAGIFLLEQSNVKASENVLEVAVVHPGIEQERRWGEQYYNDNLALYQKLSMHSFPEKISPFPRLIVWPETSLATYDIQNDGELRHIIKDFCKKNGAWFIGGFPAWTMTHSGKTYQNTAFLVSQKGRIEGRYDKKNLLPFAERKFSFFKLAYEKVTRAYSPGTGSEVVTIHDDSFTNGTLHAGMAICYESGVVSHIQKAALKKMQILVNISNDAWFGNSSESEQQLSMMALRCAEFGVPGIRGTGYGVAAIVDQFGRIIKRTGITEEAVLTGTIVVPEKPETLYRQYKDWVVLMSSFIIFLAVMVRIKGLE